MLDLFQKPLSTLLAPKPPFAKGGGSAEPVDFLNNYTTQMQTVIALFFICFLI